MNEKYIKILKKLVNKAYKKDEVPVATIVVKNNKIISKGYNKKEKNNDPTAHAEIIAIKKACKKLKSNYLNDCEIYITLEPCMMCSALIEQTHIKKINYFTKSPKYGFINNIDKKIEINYIENEYFSIILKKFFQQKR